MKDKYRPAFRDILAHSDKKHLFKGIDEQEYGSSGESDSDDGDAPSRTPDGYNRRKQKKRTDYQKKGTNNYGNLGGMTSIPTSAKQNMMSSPGVSLQGNQYYLASFSERDRVAGSYADNSYKKSGKRHLQGKKNDASQISMSTRMNKKSDRTILYD